MSVCENYLDTKDGVHQKIEVLNRNLFILIEPNKYYTWLYLMSHKHYKNRVKEAFLKIHNSNNRIWDYRKFTKRKNVSRYLLPCAIKYGAKSLLCRETKLVKIYEKYGFYITGYNDYYKAWKMSL